MPIKDPDKKAEALRQWRADNPGKRAEYSANYRDKHGMSAHQKAKHDLDTDPNDKRHGTITGYAYGCRCPKCTTAKAAEVERDRRLAREALEFRQSLRDFYRVAPEAS